MESVYDKLREARFQWSRHAFLLSPEEQHAYKAAGGGAAGRRAVLATADGNATELELHREAWLGARVLLVIGCLPEHRQHEAREWAAAAREHYQRTAGGDEWRHTAIPAPPGGFGSATHAAWADELEAAYVRFGGLDESCR